MLSGSRGVDSQGEQTVGVMRVNLVKMNKILSFRYEMSEKSHNVTFMRTNKRTGQKVPVSFKARNTSQIVEENGVKYVTFMGKRGKHQGKLIKFKVK